MCLTSDWLGKKGSKHLSNLLITLEKFFVTSLKQLLMHDRLLKALKLDNQVNGRKKLVRWRLGQNLTGSFQALPVSL